ncbi:MAG: mycofactocin biosynthesis chaperone MftB, partial [Acidimicrobiales bacterium]
MARPYRVHPQVAIRAEPFGALAYHHGSRRLTFLRSSELVELVRGLQAHASVTEALAASGLAPSRWAPMTGALAALE